MSQINIVTSKTKVIQPNVTITGVAYSSGVVITGTHAYEVGDIVQISGVVGAVEANGQWIIPSVTGTTSFTINSPSISVTSYISGGVSKHIGWVSPGTYTDEVAIGDIIPAYPVYPSSIAALILKLRIENQSGGSARFVVEDTTDSFNDAEVVAQFNSAGKLSEAVADVNLSRRIYEMPDLRIANSGNQLRVRCLLPGGVGSSATFSSWLEL